MALLQSKLQIDTKKTFNIDSNVIAADSSLCVNIASKLSAYDAYAKQLVNRRLTIPASRVAEAIEQVRQSGANVRRKPSETYDNSFAEHLDSSGFLKELWGTEVPGKSGRRSDSHTVG